MYEKNMLKCEFCGKPEAVLTINDVGVCKEHVSDIVN